MTLPTKEEALEVILRGIEAGAFDDEVTPYYTSRTYSQEEREVLARLEDAFEAFVGFRAIDNLYVWREGVGDHEAPRSRIIDTMTTRWFQALRKP